MTKRNPMTFFDIFVYVLMIFAILICILPFIYMISLSLASPASIINNRVGLFPKELNFSAYKEIFNYPNFFRAYGNTIFYTVCGTFISLVLMVLFAYPLSKSHLKGQNFIMRMVVFSMFFSGGMIPNFLLVNFLKLANTRLAMLLPFAISQFNLIILINFFRGIPVEIEEAALIDGLGYFGILRKIIIPLSTAALATVGLYVAVFFWNDWFNGLIYLKNDQYPVMLFLRSIVQGTTVIGDGAGAADKSSIGISIKSAVIIVSVLPIIVLYPFLQRFFIKGMTVGAVKG